MALDQKQIAEFLFDEAKEFETIEQFKDALHKKFVSREVAVDDEEIKNKVTGKVLGSIETRLKREFGLTEEEVKDKKVSELVELAASRQKSRIAELEKAIKEGGKGGEELAKLQEELATAKRMRDENAALAQANANKLEEREQAHKQELQSFEVRFKLDQLKAGISWAESANQFARKGWENHIAENYNFAIVDGKLIATDKAGNQIRNEKGTGNLTAEELLKLEAEKAGLVKKAGQAGTTTTTTTTKTAAQQTDAPKRPVHPRYAAARG